MPDSKVEILLALDAKLDGLNRSLTALDRTKKKTTGLSRTLGVLDKRFQSVSRGGIRLARNGIFAGGAAVIGASAVALTQATRKFGDYEKQMKGVEAILQPTRKELAGLEEITKRLGRTTSKTASQSANAVENLARQGLKYEEIVGGALESSLALSESTGAELADSAELVATALQNFNLEASETADLVDNINGVLINSKRDFESYNQAISKGAPAANLAGQSYKDFNAVITSTASFFNDGAEQGTAYARFIQKLTNDTTKAKAVQEKYGLSFFDAQGQVRDFADIAGQLSTVLESASEEDLIRDFSTAFEARAARFAVALAKAGKEGVEYSRQMNALADAQAQAEKRLEGFSGSVTKLRSAYEGLQLTFGKPIADELTPFIQALTKEISTLAGDEKKAQDLVGNFFDGLVEAGAKATDVINGLRTAWLLVKSGVLELTGAVGFLQGISLGFAKSFIIALKNIVGAQVAVGESLLQNLLGPLNFVREKLGQERIDISEVFGVGEKSDAVFDAILGNIEKIEKGAEIVLSSIDKVKQEAALDAANIIAGNNFSGDDLRGGAETIQQQAAEIKQAQNELAESTARFNQLSKEAVTAASDANVSQAEKQRLADLASAAAQGVEVKRVALEQLRGIVTEEQALINQARTEYMNSVAEFHRLQAALQTSQNATGNNSAETQQLQQQVAAQKALITAKQQALTQLRTVSAQEKAVAESSVQSATKAGDAHKKTAEATKATADASKKLSSEVKSNVDSAAKEFPKLPQAASTAAKGTKTALDGAETAFQPLQSKITETASTAQSELPKVSAAISSMVSGGSGQISSLISSFDSLQAKMRQTTAAGQAFENDAVRNSWLKDTVLKGISFLQALVSEGFDPLDSRLSTLTDAGEAASLASLQSLNQSATAGLGQGGISALGATLFDPAAAGGTVATIDDELAQINEEQSLRRAEILRNETQTAQEKNAALIELEREKNQALGDLDARFNQDRASNFESSLGQIAGLQQSNSRTLFRIGKAAAVAQATIDGIRAVQTALASAPPPFNFALAGLVGAASAVNIAKIVSQRPPSFIEGGLVGGSLDPGRTSDNVTANVATGEFITNPRATARNLPFLDFANRGGDLSSLVAGSLPSPSAPLASGKIDISPVLPAPNVTTGGTEVNILNSLDPNEVFDKMEQTGRLENWLENRLGDPRFYTMIAG